MLAVYQKDWYNNAAFMGYHLVWGNAERHIFDPERAQEQFQSAVESLAKVTRGNTVLLNNGVDHSDIQPELTDIVAEARRRHPNWDISIGGFDDYIKSIQKDLAGTRLKTHTGEMTYPFGDLLIGVYSSRMYLKQSNYACQNLLERYSEPLSALARLAGNPEDLRPYLGYAWRQLLRNHPHDDICGCSTDQVHRDMEHRFAAVQSVGNLTATEGLRRLSNRLDHSGQAGIPHVVYNPTGWKRTGPQRLTLLFNVHERDNAERFRIVDADKNVVPAVELKRYDMNWMESCKGFHFEAVDVLADVADLPGCGVKSLFVQPGKRGKKPKRTVKVTARSLDNEWLNVRVRPNGTYDLTDKITGVTYKALGLFEDVEDVGDAYNWSYAAHGARVTSRSAKAEVSVVEKTPLSAALEVCITLDVPQCIEENREYRSAKLTPLRLCTRLELLAGSRSLTIQTTLENTAEDHRLRVLFPTELSPGKVQVDGHFDVVERDVVPPMKERAWAGSMMKPTLTHCQKTFVDLTDGNRGLAVINAGLPEYEIVPERKGHTIALTLLRSVGWMSRGDFATRPGNAGPSIDAPEAQCLRSFEFRYAVMPHQGDWVAGGVMSEAQAFNAPIQVARADLHSGTVFEDVPGDIFPVPDETYMEPIPREGHLPPDFSFATIKPDSLVLSACKTAQDSDEVVLRFYNPTGRTVNGEVAVGIPVKRIRRLALDESPIRRRGDGPMTWKESPVKIKVPAHGIVTLGVTPAL